MVKRIALIGVAVLLVFLAAVLIYASTRPNDFRVERSISINAPADKIFPMIADFHRWPEWSPYENLDPGMKRTFSGSPSGQGAGYQWESRGRAGVGSMVITRADTPSAIAIDLDFTKPFEGHNIADFTLTPNGSATEVKWAMHGASPYVAKVVGIFFSMDKLVGTDFDVGLRQLKAAAEK